MFKKLLRSGVSSLLNSYLQAKLRLSSRFSAASIYSDYCLRASLDSVIFHDFRRNRIFNRMLEHVTETQGTQYIIEISKYPDIIRFIDRFKENDRFGNPRLYNYSAIGPVSPTTLRYIKVLCDLMSLSNTLDGMRICEIGIGYGGQCRVINSVFKPSSYSLVDINSVLMLAQRYLDNFALSTRLEFKTMNELEYSKYDLVISNYAFSELPREIQDVYIQKIILGSSKGYLTFNELNPEYYNSYTREELINVIPNSRITAEIPLTDPKNCIITWDYRTHKPNY